MAPLLTHSFAIPVLQTKRDGHTVELRVAGRQQAAVAADLVLTWRRCHGFRLGPGVSKEALLQLLLPAQQCP